MIRDRIALSVGALKSIRYTWPLAAGVLDTLRHASREVMVIQSGAGRGGSASSSVSGSGGVTTDRRGSTTMAGPSADPASVLGSSALEYDPRGMGADNWMAALNDPLFSQIPELGDPMGSVMLGSHIATTFA